MHIQFEAWDLADVSKSTVLCQGMPCLCSDLLVSLRTQNWSDSDWNQWVVSTEFSGHMFKTNVVCILWQKENFFISDTVFPRWKRQAGAWDLHINPFCLVLKESNFSKYAYVPISFMCGISGIKISYLLVFQNIEEVCNIVKKGLFFLEYMQIFFRA